MSSSTSSMLCDIDQEDKDNYWENPILCAVIVDLSTVTIKLSGNTQKLLLESIESLSKLEGYIKDKLASFPMLLLRTEALSSSQIEHYSASNRNIALAQINRKQSLEAVMIKSNLESLISGISSKTNLDINTIVSLNRELLNDEQIDLRKRINWIGTPARLITTRSNVCNTSSGVS